MGGAWLRRHRGPHRRAVKRRAKDDTVWWAKNFPTAHARTAADRAIDSLDPTLPMTTFLDEWVKAYAAAGGRRKAYRD